MEDRKLLTPSNISVIRQSKAVTYWHDQKHIASVIEKYKEQMISNEVLSKKSINSFIWTDSDINR